MMLTSISIPFSPKYYEKFIKNLLIVILIKIIIENRNIARSKKFKNINIMTELIRM